MKHIGISIRVSDADHGQVLALLTMVLEQIRAKHADLTYAWTKQAEGVGYPHGSPHPFN